MNPNVVLIHSHDTGRSVQPYGCPVETPNLQEFAESGILFRRCFSTSPTCGPARAALFTGTYPHRNGMMGLPHRGWELKDYSWHLANVLKKNGYITCQTGHQHEIDKTVGDASVLGYEHTMNSKTDADYQGRSWRTVYEAEQLMADHAHGDQPFFLTVGFQETHRGFPHLDDDVLESRYVAPSPGLADTIESRRDWARYRKAAKLLDDKIGAVLNAIKEQKLADNTIVIITTDHGIDYPYHKTTCSDGGLGVMLMMRGPNVRAGVVEDRMVSHLDLMPTIAELLGIEVEHQMDGKSLLPVLSRDQAPLHKYIFGEQNFHNGYDPIRTVRNERYRYSRRFLEIDRRQVHHLCGSESRDFLIANGWSKEPPFPREELFDLFVDPYEKNNCVQDEGYAAIREELSLQLDRWLRETSDPILDGPIQAPKGAKVSPFDAISADTYDVID